jgi:hypothetical protein
MAINGDAIPQHPLQSELSSYECSGFTGANQRKIGRIEAPDGGTLLLDEIGDLRLESQASLLRFLQEGNIERLGARDRFRSTGGSAPPLTWTWKARGATGAVARTCLTGFACCPSTSRRYGRAARTSKFSRTTSCTSSRPIARKIRGFTQSAIEALYNYT